MKKIKKILSNDKVERALKTFFEAFFSYLAITITTTDLTSSEAIKGVFLGAIASAMSIVINSLKGGNE